MLPQTQGTEERCSLILSEQLGILGALKGTLAAYMLCSFVLTEFHCMNYCPGLVHTYIHVYVGTYFI